MLVSVLMPVLLLVLSEAGHLGWWQKSEGPTCCRLGVRIGALRWWRIAGRQQGWLGVSAEEGADAMTTMVTAVSWCAVYCFADFECVDFDNTSHSGETNMSHLYVIKLSHMFQPSLPSYVQNPMQQLDYPHMCLAQKASIFQKKPN